MPKLREKCGAVTPSPGLWRPIWRWKCRGRRTRGEGKNIRAGNWNSAWQSWKKCLGAFRPSDASATCATSDASDAIFEPISAFNASLGRCFLFISVRLIYFRLDYRPAIVKDQGDQVRIGSIRKYPSSGAEAFQVFRIAARNCTAIFNHGRVINQNDPAPAMAFNQFRRWKTSSSRN